MSSTEALKKLFTQYKTVERCFFRVDKGVDKANYIKLKYQFRMGVTVGITAFIFSLVVLVATGHFNPGPLVILVANLVGFRFKWYTVPKVVVFMVMVIVPPRFYNNDLVFAAPTAFFFTSVQILVQTQSEVLMIIHLAFQSLVLYFYGVEQVMNKIQGMMPVEIAEIAKTALYCCLAVTWINLLTMKKFYSHVSNLLRKINVLRENLSKANAQLSDQNLKLQNNLEMKDVFIYTFSHELKNALNGLLGNLTLAYETAPKDSQLTKFLSSAKVCGEVLKNFVHNILDSGKLENGNLEVSPERRDVMSFMENVWTICGRIIENKRLQGYLDIAKNMPRYLELDEQRMIQIILNLVSNACKFTEKGHVRIQVSWQSFSSSNSPVRQLGQTENIDQDAAVGQEEEEPELCGDIREFRDTSEICLLDKEKLHLVTERQKKFITGSQFYQLTLSKLHWHQGEVLSSASAGKAKGILKVQVFDTGCGMTPKDQTLLFRKFSQTNKTASQRKVGTGLGLWICKKLAKRLDGCIKVRSEVGVGSVFELAIRTTVSHNNDKSPHPSLSADSENSQPRPTRKIRQPNLKKILIADDDSFNVELMKNYLNKFGIRYICAYDGEEAISLFKKHYEDICFVITDNFMPKKTGTEAALEITHFLKEMKKPTISIMCISGDVKVNVGEAGITSVIQKPINFDRLKEELKATFPQVSGI